MNKSRILLNVRYEYARINAFCELEPERTVVLLDITLRHARVFLRRYWPNTPICINIIYNKSFGADAEVKSTVNLGKFLLHINSLLILSDTNVRRLGIECTNEDKLYDVHRELERYLLTLNYRNDPRAIISHLRVILAGL
jgi:hypothetical protein